MQIDHGIVPDAKQELAETEMEEENVGSIQKLCDRVASSTLLDDRRNAVRALKSLSKVCNTLSLRSLIWVLVTLITFFFFAEISLGSGYSSYGTSYPCFTNRSVSLYVIIFLPNFS